VGNESHSPHGPPDFVYCFSPNAIHDRFSRDKSCFHVKQRNIKGPTLKSSKGPGPRINKQEKVQTNAVFAWLISHRPAVLFSQHQLPATSQTNRLKYGKSPFHTPHLYVLFGFRPQPQYQVLDTNKLFEPDI
jgi:hypothetical protein